MNRRRQWQLAALALALAAGTARAQTGCRSSTSPAPCSGTAAAVTWEFTTTREGGEARLQMQAGQGATATCESITLRMGGTPVTLTTDGQKVRVRGGERGGLRIDASADRAARGGEALTLEGHVQAQFELKGQGGHVRADRVTLNLSTGGVEVSSSVSIPALGPTPISLDTGFPTAKPADQSQAFTFWQGFTR